ncbi:hypothetical protein KY285_032883 [Solanum tuberosum]|nr:hypothetical protein KY285_032883 [Solanum tuberosum]
MIKSVFIFIQKFWFQILVARESYPNARSCPKEIPLDWEGRNVTESTVSMGKNLLIQRRQDLTFIPRFGPVAFPVPPLSGGACVEGAPPEIGLKALTLPTSRELMVVGLDVSMKSRIVLRSNLLGARPRQYS